MEGTKGHGDVTTVDVHTAKDLLGSGHHYLDVRSVEEFNKSHIDNALNVPYMFITEEGRVKNPDFLTQVAAISEEDHLVVGYKHVTNMGGGYSAWVDSGLAGDKPPEELKTACKFRP
ncbi:protein HIGH ARSENIC CONTENT 1, mitochondrial isoform X2 [Quercus suber]|uniref:protein HIGH ARSENIC CONTENT 1, mitochondrial isoform X2 n=1 Tax=Quercus suber TaxID=58331 RepID=UPI0032DE359C